MTTFLIAVTFVFASIAFKASMLMIQSAFGRRWWYRNVYLRMPTWKFTRQVAFLIYGRKCRVCGTPLHLDVDHKTDKAYDHLWWEWLFIWHLQVLCRYHHMKKHGEI